MFNFDFDFNLNYKEDDLLSKFESSINLNQIKEFSDNVSELVKAKFQELLAKSSEPSSSPSTSKKDSSDTEEVSESKLRNVYAGLVQSNGFDSSTCKLVCVTSGTKCITGEFMSQDGTTVNDW